MKTLLIITMLVSGYPISQLTLDGVSCESRKVVTARITGYYAKPGKKGALGKAIRPGGTAAVSRNCYFLLGEKVYIDQHGVWEVNDLTADYIGDRFNMCTIDLAQPNLKKAAAIGNEIRTVVRISR